MRSWLLLMAWCASAAVGQRPTPNKRHDVYIAGFFPFGGRVSGSIPEGRVGRGVMPAVKLAVDHINENPTLLRNYRLHVWWNDTQRRQCGGVENSQQTTFNYVPETTNIGSPRILSVKSKHNSGLGVL